MKRRKIIDFPAITLKVLLIFIIVNCSLLIAHCYAQSITWFRSYGGSDYDAGYAIIQTPDNGYILAGETMGGLILAMRLNPYGDTVWTRIYPGYIGSNIIKTSDNNYVILGGFSHITKIDINGNVIWTKGPFNPNFKSVSIKETTEGSFILAGWKDTMGLFNKPYLIKLNSNGNMIWGRSYTANIIDGGFGNINIAYDNNYLLTGSYSDTYNQDEKLFLMKTDTAGVPIFFYGYDTIKYSMGKFVYQNSSNSFIIGGRYHTSPFLAKINSSGAIQWFYRYINYNSNCNRITNTIDNGYALTGWWDTAGTEIDFYAYLIKTDSNGIEQFRKIYLYAPMEGNSGLDIKQTSDSGYIITGTRYNYNIDDIIVIKTDKYGFTQIIGIQPISSTIPKNFKLYQNYPNPFNPTTKIKLDVPFSSNVKLSIINILGEEISVLVNEKLSAGTFEVEFRAKNISTGIYFYRIIANNNILTKKMVVLK